LTRITLFIVLMMWLTSSFCQSKREFEWIIDNFANVEDMPYICDRIDNSEWAVGCGDSIFWDAVSQGREIIPYLLERICDSTQSKAYVPNFGGIYTVGDISLVALQMLVWDIPVLELAEDPNHPEPRNGYWGYWKYVRRNHENRVKFGERVIAWYESKKDHLVWIESGEIRECDCGILENPAGGHFEINKQ